MCDLGSALMVASTGMSAAGSIMQGKQAEAMGRTQQAAYDQAADDTRRAASYEMTREFERNRKIQSKALTQIAASGVDLSGSPVEALVENAVQSALDIEAIQFNSKIKENQLRTQGEVAAYGGQQKKQAGYIGAASTAVNGLSQLYSPRGSVRVGTNPFGNA